MCFFAHAVNAQTLLILGDSLSAGYQMSIEQAWPSLLADTLTHHNPPIQVVNASISGDTTLNGLNRLPALLKQHKPTWVLIELGANDALRGFPVPTIKKNLTSLITQVQATQSQVLLMQIRIPPNYGKKYTQQFENIYSNLAQQYALPLLPFFMEEVVLRNEWMMNDGLHPNSKAQPWIAEFMTLQLLPWL